jgi:hypothetical protein
MRKPSPESDISHLTVPFLSSTDTSTACTMPPKPKVKSRPGPSFGSNSYPHPGVTPTPSLASTPGFNPDLSYHTSANTSIMPPTPPKTKVPQGALQSLPAIPHPALQGTAHPTPPIPTAPGPSPQPPSSYPYPSPHTNLPSRDLISYLIPNTSSNHTSNAAPSAPAPAYPPNKPLPPQHSAHQLASQALQKRLWSHQQHISGRQLLLKNKELRYPRDTVLSVPQQLQEDIAELRAYIAEERAKNVKWGNMLYDALDYERMGLLGEKRLEALLMELEGSELMGYGWSTDVTWSTDAPS